MATRPPAALELEEHRTDRLWLHVVTAGIGPLFKSLGRWMGRFTLGLLTEVCWHPNRANWERWTSKSTQPHTGGAQVLRNDRLHANILAKQGGFSFSPATAQKVGLARYFEQQAPQDRDPGVLCMLLSV